MTDGGRERLKDNHVSLYSLKTDSQLGPKQTEGSAVRLVIFSIARLAIIASKYANGDKSNTNDF